MVLLAKSDGVGCVLLATQWSEVLTGQKACHGCHDLVSARTDKLVSEHHLLRFCLRQFGRRSIRVLFKCFARLSQDL